jgi:transcriptional regulator with XRE-family HTH domain
MKRTVRKLNAITQAQLIKLLLDGIYTCEQLAEETGLHFVTVLQYTRELHRFGAAHISSWEKDSRGRDIIKVYKIGIGKDAKREKLTGAERQERVREKRRAHQMAQVMAGTARFVPAANGRLRFEAVA